MSPTVHTWQVRRLGYASCIAVGLGARRSKGRAVCHAWQGGASQRARSTVARARSHLYVWTQTQSLLVQTVSTSRSCPLTRQMTCACVRVRPTNTRRCFLSRARFTSRRERDNKPPRTLAASAFVCVSFFTRTFKRSSSLGCESFTFNLALLLFVRFFFLAAQSCRISSLPSQFS